MDISNSTSNGNSNDKISNNNYLALIVCLVWVGFFIVLVSIYFGYSINKYLMKTTFNVKMQRNTEHENKKKEKKGFKESGITTVDILKCSSLTDDNTTSIS